MKDTLDAMKQIEDERSKLKEHTASLQANLEVGTNIIITTI